MANCPLCNTPGAYIGFNTVECRNPDCEHFVLFEEEICPCCGQAGHDPEKHAAAQRQRTQQNSQQAAGNPNGAQQSIGTVYLDGSDPTLDALASTETDAPPA